MMQAAGSGRFKARHGLFAVFLAVVAAAVTWPGYSTLGNSVEPFLLGLPLSFAWNIIWIGLTWLGLVVYHFSRGARR